MIDANPRVDSTIEIFPSTVVIDIQQIKDVVIMSKISISHSFNRSGTTKHLVVNVSLVGKTSHCSDFVLEKMRLEHTSEVMLVFDRVPFKHTSGQHTITVFVVTNDLIDSSNTSSNASTRCFHNFLENCEVEVVEETNWNVDRVTSETLNHFHN